MTTVRSKAKIIKAEDQQYLGIYESYSIVGTLAELGEWATDTLEIDIDNIAIYKLADSRKYELTCNKSYKAILIG